MIRAIRLHGQLARRFGRRFELDVNTTAEAVRALCYQIPGFEKYFRERNYVIAVDGKRAVTERELGLGLGRAQTLDIMPAPQMAGIETIVLIGLTVISTALSIATLVLSPKPPKPGSRERDTKTDSFVFDGPQNRTEQGHPVALHYGRILAGSVVVSQGISTSDVNAAGFETGLTHVGTLPGFAGGLNGIEWVLSKGGKSGGGAARSAQEDPNTLQSQATARVIDLIGEGEIRGLVNGMQSVYFDGTPLQNPDGTFNFAGVSVDQRFGLPDQEPLGGFSGTENTISIGTEVKISTGPVTRAISDNEADVARVTISLPRLFRQDITNGDLKRNAVTIAISLQSNGGGFTEILQHTFDGKNVAPYQRSFDIRLSGPAPHNVRVTRITPDATLSSVEDETFFDLLTEIIEAKLVYPDSALIGLTVDARQFGSSIPARAYEIYGLIVDVPTNYDPITRVYTGVWNGTFKRAWTDNPAWVVNDLVSNKRYGLGRRVPEWARDKWSLYAISQYSDGLVPNGAGGTRPRFTFNGSITTKAQAYDVIASVAGAFRGWAYWGSGTVMFAQDRPEDPTIVVARENVVDGRIKYDRITPLDKRRSVVIMHWNDPADNYRLVPEIVEKPDLIRRFGWEPGDELTAFGCTNQSQARMMAELVFEDEGASNAGAAYDVGDDHSFVEPGRIVEIADPQFSGQRLGGRIAAATANSITLDGQITLADGVNYFARVVLPDGTTPRRAITNAASTTAVINLGGAAFAANPINGAVWSIESNLVKNRQFRVRQIGADGPPYSVRAVRHDPTKYARAEQGALIQPDNFLGLPTGGLTPPGDISVFEFLIEDGNAAIPSATISWIRSDDPRVTFYQSQYRRPGGRFEPLGDSIDLSRDLRGIEPGSWAFRVRAVDSLGRKTGWIQYSVNLVGSRSAPPAPTGLSVISDDDALTAVLKWTAPNDTRPLRYEVFFSTANVYAGAASLGVTDQFELPIKLAGFYWVRSVFMDAVTANPPVLQVTTGDFPEPKYGRIQGRPTTLTQFDAVAGAQLAGVLVDVAALEATYGETASAAASAVAANDAKIAAQGFSGAASSSATVSGLNATATAQDSRVAAAFGRTVGLTPNGNFSSGVTLWGNDRFALNGGSAMPENRYFAIYQARADVLVANVGETLSPTSGVFPLDRTKKITIKAEIFSGLAGCVHYLGLTFFDANDQYITVRFATSRFVSAGAGWIMREAVFDGTEGGGASQYPANAVKAQVCAVMNNAEPSVIATNTAINFLYGEDVTQLAAANAAANAAQGSSATAGAQASLALSYAQQAASIGLNTLNREPTFGSYVTSGPAPLGWINGSGPLNYQSVSGETSGRAARRSAAINESSWAYSDPPVPIEPGQWLILEAHVKLNSGTLTGAGLFFDKRNAGNGPVGALDIMSFATANNNTGVAAGVGEAGRVYRFSKLIQIDPALSTAKSAFLFFANHYSPIDSIAAANDLTWYRVGVRAATPQEIRDQTVLDPIQATVLAQSGALATLQGEATSFWQVEGNAGSGAAFFISARARSAYGDTPSSDVSFGAREVHIFNEVGGVYKKALSAIGGNVVLEGGLSVGAFIRLGSGEGWPVALRSREFTVSDGSTINFGADLGGLPAIDFSTIGLAALVAGESYRLTTTTLLSTTATVSLKIITPGATTNYSLTVDSAPGSGPTRQIDIAGNPESTSGAYTVAISFNSVFNQFSAIEPGFGNVNYYIWVKKSGTWLIGYAATELIDNGTGNANKSFSKTESIQLGAGAQAFGFSITGFDGNITGVNALDLASVSWSAQAAGVTRSATPAGETTKAIVRPQ